MAVLSLAGVAQVVNDTLGAGPVAGRVHALKVDLELLHVDKVDLLILLVARQARVHNGRSDLQEALLTLAQPVEGSKSRQVKPSQQNDYPKVIFSAVALQRIMLASGDMLSTSVKPALLRNTWLSILAAEVSLYFSSAARVILSLATKMHFLGSSSQCERAMKA